MLLDVDRNCHFSEQRSIYFKLIWVALWLLIKINGLLISLVLYTAWFLSTREQPYESRHNSVFSEYCLSGLYVILIYNVVCGTKVSWHWMRMTLGVKRDTELQLGQYSYLKFLQIAILICIMTCRKCTFFFRTQNCLVNLKQSRFLIMWVHLIEEFFIC